ncbi:MAG: Deblocking aminopeptidase [Candidatus Ozemobacter sibiricus]|uniref:Deblocking aminopeptidase n=1 Tax=Candidatus Ozemobacter sibiricus TaxID=2268124 RepID=A0A367ZQI7_9BACT|nr:MAG: Deblocking aminopeptidase [Candidatus Ozemobacter sibiricus]
MAIRPAVRPRPRERVVDLLEALIAVPSPSGFAHDAIAHVQKVAQAAGLQAQVTNKGGLVVGNHPRPRLVVSGHVDTLGAMVSGINADGHLAFTKIGGPLLPSFEGNHVTIVTGGGQRYTGTLILQNPAAHVNKEAGTLERKPENMYIRLDCEVSAKKDTEALGIAIGDFVLFDPGFRYTETGFVKSHFLDDKAGCAVMMDGFLRLGAARLKKLPVCFFFSNYEEVGHGAAAGFPDSALEMLVIDMGVVGRQVAGDEFSVSICVKDSSGPYDYGIRQTLTRLARERRLPYKLDVFPFYGSDGSAALVAGHNIRVGLIGPGVSASHGSERTHVKGLLATRDLMLAYIEETLG